MVDQIVVRILHNENERDSFMRGYAYGDPLKEIYEGKHRLPYRLDSDVSLEFIYAQNQWVDDVHRPWYNDARSLSKGDVIVLHHRAFAVESIGFKEIDPVQAEIQELVA